MKSSSLLRTSFSELLSLVKNRWPAYIWYTFGQVLVGVGILLLLWMSMMMFSSLLRLFVAPEITEMVVVGLLGFAIVLVVMAVQYYFTFGMYRLADERSADMSLHAFHVHASRRFWRTFGNLILFGLLVGVIVLAAAAIIYALTMNVSSSVAQIISVIFAVLAIYFGLPAAFVMLQIVLNDDGPVKAYGQIYRLISGRWWRTLGSSFLVMVISSLPLFAVSLLMEMMDPTNQLQYDAGESPLDVMSGVSNYFSDVSSFLLLLLVVVVTIVLNIFPTYAYLGIFRSLKKVKS